MARYTTNYNLREPVYGEHADVEDINRNFETVDHIMHETQLSLAQPYDETKTYNTGDVTLIEYRVWEALEDGITGSWDETKWRQVTLSDCAGTKVHANPEGTPMESLNALEVNGVVYEVPKGSDTEEYIFHINGNESDPDSMITYLGDAVNMTPAHMDYTNDVFDYGSWALAFFVKGIKPCVLDQDGTVRTYLDRNDYSKDVYGNATAIDSNLTGANVMIEFPKIWYKIVPDDNNPYSATIYIANKKLDAGYVDYAYIDQNGNHKEHFYMSAYNNTVIDGVMRSVSGAQATRSASGTTEISRAEANGNGWYIEQLSQITLINLLLMLIGKSTDTQTVFGQGLHTGGSQAINDEFRTGVHNTKGLFYGTNSGTASDYTNAVKVFGIENYWGFQWRRYAGHMNLAGQQVIKMCWGTEDGSTESDYNTTGSGYINAGDAPSGTSGGYIKTMKYTINTMLLGAMTGSASTYYTDGGWFNNDANTVALRGGSSYSGLPCGAFYCNLSNAVGSAHWTVAAAASFT